MVKAIIELSNYILVLNLLLYTIISFVLLPKEDEERSSFLLVLQDVFIFINHLTGSLVLLSTRHDMTYLFYPVFQMIAIFSFFVLMRAIYPKSNRLLLNHIGLLLSVSFVILTRLSFSRSVKQFAIVAVSMIIALIIPSLMKYLASADQRKMDSGNPWCCAFRCSAGNRKYYQWLETIVFYLGNLFPAV